jgi:hypothetical protein
MAQTNLSAQWVSAQWAEKLKPLVGRTIVGVRYLDTAEAGLLGIAHQPVCLQLDDSTLLWPMADDEGNDAGVLFFQAGTKTSGLPAGAPRIRI